MTFKKRRIIILLSALLALSIGLFAVANPSIWPKPNTETAQQTAERQDPSEAPSEAQPTPPEAAADPIPETPVVEAVDDNGSIIVEHHLPDDTNPALAEQYTAHFARWEFACDGDDCSGFPVEMDAALLEKLEALRTALGRPVVITSGLRCETRNAEVGGIAGSRHLSGKAADLYCPGVPYDDVAEAARSVGLWVLAYPEEQYIHVEV